MAITPHRGYALIVAVIIMTMMLSFGLSLGALAYKQQILASGARESQYAFYAADAGNECALYADQQLNTFDYASAGLNTHPAAIDCAGNQSSEVSYTYDDGLVSGTPHLQVTDRVVLDTNLCADITVYKKPTGSVAPTTFLYVQGYNVACTTVASLSRGRIVARGVSSRY